MNAPAPLPPYSCTTIGIVTPLWRAAASSHRLLWPWATTVLVAPLRRAAAGTWFGRPPPRDRSPPPVIDSSSPMPLPPTLWPPLLQLCATAVRASSDCHSSDWSPPASVGAWRRRVRGKFPLCRQSLCSGGQSWLSTNKLILAITERNNYAQCLCDLISDIVFR
jgi:hypothetical protein